MVEPWVWFTLLAACMQALRTAGQKKLVRELSPMATTLVRYLFGLPFVCVYLVLIAQSSPLEMISSGLHTPPFITYGAMASVAQIAATFWLVKLLECRNFAVGTSFAKTEAIQTAIFGAIFFGAFLSPLGWLAVALGVFGIILMSLPAVAKLIDARSISYGLLSGAGFAFTSLWLREASLSLHFSFTNNAALTLVYMVSLQSALCLVYIAMKEAGQFAAVLAHYRVAIFVGASSALGSVGWFTAMTYQNAALVKSLGQIELVFTLLITTLFFKEKVSAKEAVGISAIVASIVLLLMLA